MNKYIYLRGIKRKWVPIKINIKNTGQELKLRLYEEPVEEFDIEGGNSVRHPNLSDNYETIFIENGHAFERLNQNEIDEIYENLPGLKMPTNDW